MNRIPSQQPIKTFQPFNLISKNKKHNSDFRVHFTLMNVKWKCRQGPKQQKLVQYALGMASYYCNVHIAQIASVIADDVFDVSFGLSNDEEAYLFLKRKEPIVLSDCYQQHQYYPVVSRVFQSYMNAIQKKQTKIIVQKQTLSLSHNKLKQVNLTKQQSTKQTLKQKSSINEYDQRNFLSTPIFQKRYSNNKYDQNIKYSQNESKNKQKIKDSFSKDKQFYKLLAFGIPKQIQIPQIKQALKKQAIQAGQCKWKQKQHMQYLQIDLINPISRNNIYYLGLQVDGYPYVVIPSIQQNQIPRQLSKYTVQIITKPSQNDQEKFIKCMFDIGGVNMMIRTPIKQKDDYRILVVFNNVQNADRACRAARQIKDCIAQRKQYELKIGRVSKFYTFTALAKELNLQKQ